MKVTKYPQSCLLLEKDGRRILIDPGSFVAEKYHASEFGKVEAVLYTHQHGDHYDEGFSKSLDAPKYGNKSVCELIGSDCKLVESGKEFELAGFKILPHDLPHCKMVDGSDGPQNTGFIIDDNFFDPGDGIDTEGVSVENAAIPIAGPSISMYDAAQFVLKLGVKKVIPIHYSNVGYFPGDPDGFKTATAEWFKLPFEVVVLADGESTEL